MDKVLQAKLTIVGVSVTTYLEKDFYGRNAILKAKQYLRDNLSSESKADVYLEVIYYLRRA